MPISIDLNATPAESEGLGGKGEQLSCLIRAGLNVPLGFVLTFQAQALTLAFSGLQAAPDSSISDERMLLKWSLLQRKCLLTGACPLEVRNAMWRGIGGLKGPFAIRSSGRMEDGTAHSWAGMFDTFLDVDRETVESDVLRVWASNYSERSLAYRRMLGVATQVASWDMAVVIQQMVKPVLSGVLLSRDPRPNYHNEWMITEIVSGGGSELVSGSINPQRYLLHRQTGEAVREDHGLERLPPSFLPDEPTGTGLSSSNCFQDLHRFGLEIEALLSGAANIEWCWDASKIWFLQARPSHPALSGQEKKLTAYHF